MCYYNNRNVDKNQLVDQTMFFFRLYATIMATRFTHEVWAVFAILQILI
jgi:hypothetical protein